MNYIRAMAIRIALVLIPAFAAIVLVALLDAFNATGGIVVVAYTAVAVAIGTGIGRSVDRLPGAGSKEEGPTLRHRYR